MIVSQISKQVFRKQQLSPLISRVFFGKSELTNAPPAEINAPPAEYVNEREALKKNIWRDTDPTHKKSQGTHMSNGEYLIHRVPVIYSTESIVRCIGGTELNTGHPQVYIQLNTRTPGEPVSCKWCGLKYALDTHHH